MKFKFKIELSQKTADRLMILYREMDLVDELRFDQDICYSCVIGHGIRSGKLNGFNGPVYDEFEKAIEWIGLPNLPEYGEVVDGIQSMNLLESYLFDSSLQINSVALALKLPRSCTTPKDAQKRIKAVLNAAGYELTWDK